MEFIKLNWYWFLSGIIIVGLTTWGIIYASTGPGEETEFIITSIDEQNKLNLDIFDYDFPNYNWLENFPTEFTKIAPPTNSGSSNLSAPVPTQSVETPWEQGASDQNLISEPSPVIRPPALPNPSGTPWTDGPSN